MSEATASTPKFACPSCGRQFTWKPELAGKGAKCKCGATITVPAKPQAASQGPAAVSAKTQGAGATSRVASAPPPPPPPPAAEGNPLDAAYDFAEPDAAVAPPKRAASAAGAAPVQGTAARCPSCGANMLPGAVICVSCGFNLKTGQRMGTVVGAEASPVAAAAPAARPSVAGAFGAPSGPKPVSRGAGSDSNAGQVVKIIAIPVVLLAVVGGAVFGFRMLSSNPKDLGPAKGKDREVRAMMEDDGAFELKQWLKDGGNRRLVSGMTVHQADGLADRLYTMGAVKVYAFGAVMTMSLAIELPQEPEKREALFDWQRRWHSEMNQPVQRDEGQQYLLIQMRL